MPILFDHKGKLAIGWIPLLNQDEPYLETPILVSEDIPASRYRHLLTQRVQFFGDLGRVWPEGENPVLIPTASGWTHETIREYVSPPRGGKSQGDWFGWTWSMGAWRKT
jgi:hypothetical protein